MAKRERSLFTLGLLMAAGGAFLWLRRFLEDEDRAQQTAGWRAPQPPAQAKESPSPAGHLQNAPDPLPVAPAQHEPADDLTEINGIGATYARRLQAAGIRTFADLAALSPEEAREAAKAQPWQADPATWVAQAQERLETG